MVEQRTGTWLSARYESYEGDRRLFRRHVGPVRAVRRSPLQDWPHWPQHDAV